MSGRFWIALLGAVICIHGFAVCDANAQGTATGWVIADRGDSASDIQPGENSTQVFAGANSLNVTNSSTSPNGNVETQASFPDVKIRVDGAGLVDGQVAYGAAYFEDQLTVLGGVGSFEMSMRWTFDGGISGDGGEYWVRDDPGIGARSGSAAVNFRSFIQRFGQDTLDLSDTDLFKDVALEPTGSLEVPYFDPFDMYSNRPDGGSFLFDEIDEEGEPTGEYISGWYTDQNANALTGLGGGARFNWEYGVPMDFGILLEGWAADGGMVDFYNTGTFTEIILPAGASLVSAGGGNYNVTNSVPEPTAATVLLLGLIGAGLRRKRVG